jgi:hypothetical protein
MIFKYLTSSDSTFIATYYFYGDDFWFIYIFMIGIYDTPYDLPSA